DRRGYRIWNEKQKLIVCLARVIFRQIRRYGLSPVESGHGARAINEDGTCPAYPFNDDPPVSQPSRNLPHDQRSDTMCQPPVPVERAKAKCFRGVNCDSLTPFVLP